MTESWTQRRNLINVECVMETTPLAGDFPRHSTRQGLVRFGGMFFRIRSRSLPRSYEPLSCSVHLKSTGITSSRHGKHFYFWRLSNNAEWLRYLWRPGAIVMKRFVTISLRFPASRQATLINLSAGQFGFDITPILFNIIRTRLSTARENYDS